METPPEEDNVYVNQLLSTIAVAEQNNANLTKKNDALKATNALISRENSILKNRVKELENSIAEYLRQSSTSDERETESQGFDPEHAWKNF